MNNEQKTKKYIEFLIKDNVVEFTDKGGEMTTTFNKNDFNSTLTEEELAVDSCFEWSDETLGGLTRWLAERLKETKMKDWETVSIMASIYNLINHARKFKAESLNIKIDRFSDKGKLIGDWRVIVKKINRGEK